MKSFIRRYGRELAALIIIVLSLGIIIGVFGWHYTGSNSSSSAETMLWKQFRSAHISFRYPSGWTVRDTSYGLPSGQRLMQVNVIGPQDKGIALPADLQDPVAYTQLSFQLTNATADGQASLGRYPGETQEPLITKPSDPARLCSNQNGFDANEKNLPECKVAALGPFLTIDNVRSRLIVTAFGVWQLTDSANVVIGDSDFMDGVFVSGQVVQINGGLIYRTKPVACDHYCPYPDPSTEDQHAYTADSLLRAESLASYTTFLRILRSVAT